MPAQNDDSPLILPGNKRTSVRTSNTPLSEEAGLVDKQGRPLTSPSKPPPLPSEVQHRPQPVPIPNQVRTTQQRVNDAVTRIEQIKTESPVVTAHDRIAAADETGKVNSPSSRLEQAAASAPVSSSPLILPTRLKKPSQQVKPLTPPQSPPQKSPVSKKVVPEKGFTKTQKAAGITRIIAGQVENVVTTAARSTFPPSSQKNTSNPSPFLRPAKERWEALLTEYPELDRMTEEGFKRWLPKHEGEPHPARPGEKISMDDWLIDHKAYVDYQEAEKARTAQPFPRKRPAVHSQDHGHGLLLNPLHPLISDTPYSFNQPPTGEEGDNQLPSQPRDTSSFQPPPRQRNPLRGGGRGGRIPFPTSFQGAAKTVAKRFLFSWGGLIALICLVFLIFILALTIDEDEGGIEVTVEQSTDNPESAGVTSDMALGGSSVAGISSSSSVLAATDQDFNELVQRVINKLESRITYTYTVRYDGVAKDIILTNTIPSNAFFLSATDGYKVTKSRTQFGSQMPAEIRWSVKDLLQNGGTTTSTSPTPTASVSSTPRPTQPQAQPTPPTTGGKVNVSRYTQAPYYLPAPNGNADVTYSAEAIARFNKLGALIAKHQQYLISKSKGAAYVDPFLSVIWNGAIEGISGNQYFYNCYNNTNTLNNGCDGYSSGNWQVGWGMQVSQAAPHMAEDFDAAYGQGASNNATMVQQVGQAVINGSGGKITYPRTFPSKTIPQLVQEAPSNRDSRQAVAILLMDDELGAIAMAREVAADIGGLDNWRRSMEGWGSYYSINMQKFANRMGAIAEQYTGASNTTPGPGTTGPDTSGRQAFPVITVQITMVPLVAESVFVNNPLYVDVIDGKRNKNASGNTTTTASNSASSVNGSELLGYANQIAQNLQPGVWNYYNKMLGDVQSKDGVYVATKRQGATDAYANGEQLSLAGLYWCTFIVIDSYNLVGKRGLVPSEHLAVMNMIPFFKSTPGYKYLDYDRQDHKTILQQVKPGFAFFIMAHTDAQAHTGQEHTGLVKEISLDANGNGFIETYESNSDQTGHRFPVSNWDVKNTFYPLRGFGGT